MGVAAYWGAFEVGADRPHWALTERMLALVRSRSVAASARTVVPPDLVSEDRVRAGAGNYDAMCAQCHLRPGVPGTEISTIIYPPPPNFTTKAPAIDRESFWVIKHGIKMTGMGAWGRNMSDDDIWSLVAFLRMLPALSPAEYESLVSGSAGHTHRRAEPATAPHRNIMPHPASVHGRGDDRPIEPGRACAHGNTNTSSHARSH